MLIIGSIEENKQAEDFCNTFIYSNDRPKYIFGRNEYAESIAELIEVDGFIDDFTKEKEYLGKPICDTESVPSNAIVVSVVLGRPLTAKRCLDEFKLQHLDYFYFYRYSGLEIKPITCWNEFTADFNTNKYQYEHIYNLLADEQSRSIFTSVINFRLSGNLKYMEGFSDQQDKQYFEQFLELSDYGEAFVDVGGFDGNTSLEFIKYCPGYKAIHFFEPEASNMAIAMNKLAEFKSIKYYELALSDRKEMLKFSIDGSCSSINENGDFSIKADSLDNIISEPVSYIKIDIEGFEKKALAGSKQTIIKYHPRLAVCVYHRGDDIWRIPQQIFSFRKDYDLYLRHYTEGVDETVMFFIPRKGKNE